MSGKKILRTVLFTTCLIITAGCSQRPAVVIGDRDGWHKISESAVDFQKEREEITLVGSNRFAKLQLFVYDASIDLQDMDVYYENGEKQHVSQLTPLIENRKSKIIDVKGAESSITKVTFVYKTLPNKDREKGMVQLWGYKTNVIDNSGEKKAEPKEEKKVTGKIKILLRAKYQRLLSSHQHQIHGPGSHPLLSTLRKTATRQKSKEEIISAGSRSNHSMQRS